MKTIKQIFICIAFMYSSASNNILAQHIKITLKNSKTQINYPVVIDDTRDIYTQLNTFIRNIENQNWHLIYEKSPVAQEELTPAWLHRCKETAESIGLSQPTIIFRFLRTHPLNARTRLTNSKEESKDTGQRVQEIMDQRFAEWLTDFRLTGRSMIPTPPEWSISYNFANVEEPTEEKKEEDPGTFTEIFIRTSGSGSGSAAGVGD